MCVQTRARLCVCVYVLSDRVVLQHMSSSCYYCFCPSTVFVFGTTRYFNELDPVRSEAIVYYPQMLNYTLGFRKLLESTSSRSEASITTVRARQENDKITYRRWNFNRIERAAIKAF